MEAIKEYIAGGLHIIRDTNGSMNLGSIRSAIETEFSNHGYPRDLDLHLFSNLDLRRNLISLVFSQSNTDFLRRLSENLGTTVYILPILRVMRNYYTAPWSNVHGWHSDCGGELRYPMCRELMNSSTYCFGKIGIYFQTNSVSTGGGIEILKGTHRSIRLKGYSIRFRVANAVRRLLHRLSPVSSVKSKWISDIPFFFRSMVNSNPFDNVFFDSRIMHRGTPPSPDVRRILYDNSINQAEFHISQFPPGVPNKYALYAQFGTISGIQSYFIDRMNREGNRGELEDWLVQLSDLEFSAYEYARTLRDILISIRSEYI